MESIKPESSAVPTDDAARTLSDLRSDRESLVDRIRPPRWYYLVLALVAAAWVATPAIAADRLRITVSAVLFALYVVLVAIYPRLTGVRANRVGWRTGLLLFGGLVLTLVLFSVSLGVVASVSSWWVLVPTAVSFVAVLLLGFATEPLRRRSVHVDR